MCLLFIFRRKNECLAAIWKYCCYNKGERQTYIKQPTLVASPYLYNKLSHFHNQVVEMILQYHSLSPVLHLVSEISERKKGKPANEKTCFMSYVNNEGANQSAHFQYYKIFNCLLPRYYRGMDWHSWLALWTTIVYYHHQIL